MATVLGCLTPAGRARVTAAATVAEGLNLAVWRAFAPAVTMETSTVADIEVDVYAPAHDAPTMLLVPGAAPGGREDPRVIGLATAFARSDRRVVVPELEVYDQKLVPQDVDRLVRLTAALSSPDRPVVLLGISFGGSLSLVAAADPRLEGRVRGVATYGAYADLVGVAQAATTGTSVVAGETIPWDADPRAEELVQDELLSLLPSAEAEAVRQALETGQTGQLDGPAQTIHTFLNNDDPERTFVLAEQLPGQVRDRLAAVSPTSVADELSDVEVVAMHGRDDPIIPRGELLRLGQTVPHARLLTVDSLEHADPELTSPAGWLGTLDDLQTIWSFTSTSLRWQEPTLPWERG